MVFSLTKGQKILYYGILLSVTPIIYYHYRSREKSSSVKKKIIKNKLIEKKATEADGKN